MVASNITPIAGVNLTEIRSVADGPRFKVGTAVMGSDGHMHIYATASGAITTAQACVLTEPAMTMAAGAGAWTGPVLALATGEHGWFRETAIA